MRTVILQTQNKAEAGENVICFAGIWSQITQILDGAKLQPGNGF